MPTQPPDIHFYEEKSLSVDVEDASGITRFLRKHSFGLIKTEGQATLVLLVLLIAAGAATYLFVHSQKTQAPTTTFDILPQESVGSSQGLPANSNHETQ